MKKHNKLSAKLLSLALAMAMVVDVMPGIVFAQEMGDMSECHAAHDENCGYIAMAEGTPCAHLNDDGAYACAQADADEAYTCLHHDECGFAEAVESAPCVHSCELCEVKDNNESENSGEIEESSETENSSEVKVGDTPPKCTCTERCVNADEETETNAAINTACLACGIDNADLAKCAGEAPVMLANAKNITKRTLELDLVDYTDAPLDKDGRPITGENGIFDMLTTEGWKWDKNTMLLTLNGLNIDVTGNQYALELPAGVTIVCEGSNSLESDNTDTLHGLGNLEIGGSGSLTVVSNKFSGIAVNDNGNLTITGGTLDVSSLGTGNSTQAIWVNGSINILGGNITACSDSSGIWATEDMVIDGAAISSESQAENAIGASGTLTISNGANIEAESNYPPLYSGKDMFIAGSTVNVSSEARAAINSDGNITFTDSTITAKSILSNYTAIYTGKTITVNGSSQVFAEGDWRGIHGDTSVVIHDTAYVEATGKSNDGIYSKDVQIFGDAVVKAKSRNGAQGAITGIESLTITEDSEVEADGCNYGIYAEGPLVLSGKMVNVYARFENGIFSADNIAVGGKLTVESKGYFAICSMGTITADSNANINASCTFIGGAMQAGGDVIFNGSTVVANATLADAIYSYGTIQINGGSIYAKGDTGYVAIRARTIQQSGEAAVSKIALTDMLEKSGGKVAFSDWNSFGGDSTSWTSFIGKDTVALEVDADGDISNGLLEIWLAAPFTVTFDVNGGSGTDSDIKVYPGDKVTAPKTDPTKDGCHFSGWYYSDTKFDFVNTAITEDMTLKAKLDAHVPQADDGTCTTAVVCTVCNEITTSATTHVVSGWQSDATNHWKKCTNAGCTHTEQSVAHTPEEDDGNCTTAVLCTVCDYELTAAKAHVLSDWQSNATNHWKKCTNTGCTHTEQSAAHTPEEDDGDCTTAVLCTVCGYETTAAKEHALSDWQNDATNHWKKCTNAGCTYTEQKAAHTYGDWVVDTEATEDAKGSKHRDCSVCTYSETVEIPVLPHTHKPSAAWSKDATGHWHNCTADDGEKLELAAHSFGEWVIDTQATETEAGSKHRDCSVCAYTETAEVPTLPHTHKPATEWSKDAQSHWHNCTANDGERLNAEIHSFGEWIVDTEATETTAGKKHRECGICAYREIADIPVLPHTHKPAAQWLSDAESHWHNCTANDGTRLDLAAHTPGAAPTVEHGQACTICGYELVPKLPSKDSIVDEATGIKAEYEDGSVFDAEIELVVTPKSAEEMKKYQDSVDKAAKGFSLAGLYDIKLLKEGVAIQPDGKIKITLTLTAEMKGLTDLQVAYIDDSGTASIIPSQLNNDKLIFITDHFSYYGVIGKEAATPTPIPTAKPTENPTATPAPTVSPTTNPTAAPTAKPTENPTATPAPTVSPTTNPTAAPTAKPTESPTATPAPTVGPTTNPTAAPTTAPTAKPTEKPNGPQTGDTSNTLPYIALFVLSAGCLITILIRRRKAKLTTID